MNEKERVKLVFETLSKIAGFEVKPDKPFRIKSCNFSHITAGMTSTTIYRFSDDFRIIKVTNRHILDSWDFDVYDILYGGIELVEFKEEVKNE